MKVYLVRSAQKDCEPDCPQWIAAQGMILPGTLGQFKKVLAELHGRKVPVLVHSGGGMADEALAIGHLLRTQALDVGVAKTVFTPCAPDAAACRRKEGRKPLQGLPDTASFSACASACAFVLAAGTRRFVRLPAFVGVHRGEMIQKRIQHTYRMTPYRADDGSIRYTKKLISEKVVSERHSKAPEKVYSKYEKYFSEMGVDKAIMPIMLATPNDSVHWLSRDELRATRMATHSMDGGQLIRGATAPADGWDTPIEMPPALSLRDKTPQECLLHGMNCGWQLKPSATASGGKSSAPVPPIMTGPELPPAAAQDCTRSGKGCSWPFAPGAPAGGAAGPSTPSQ